MSSISLSFPMGSPDDVDATYEKLVAAGYHGHQAPWDAFWGQRDAMIRDRDGHPVDLLPQSPKTVDAR